tara:strand:+ start:4929 stop:6134 length:1206 start_codon:yes stop_codon:yes gene_type:complete
VNFKIYQQSAFTKFIKRNFRKQESLDVVLFGYNKITNTWLNFYETGSGFNQYNFNVLGIVDYAISTHPEYHQERLNNHNNHYSCSFDNHTIYQWLQQADLAIVFDYGTATDSPDRELPRDLFGMGMVFDGDPMTKDSRNQVLGDIHNLMSEHSQSCFVWEIPQYEVDFYFDLIQGSQQTNKKLCLWSQDYVYRLQGDSKWDYNRVYRSTAPENSKRVMWHFNDYTTIKNNYAKNIFILSDKWASGKTGLSKELYLKDTGSYQILATEPALETLGLFNISPGNKNGGFVEKINYYNNIALKDKESKTFIIPMQGAYNPNMTSSYLDENYLPELNKQIHAVGSNHEIKNHLGRNFGVSQSIVWLVNNPNNYSQSLGINNIDVEFRFTGSMNKSDMATTINNNF